MSSKKSGFRTTWILFALVAILAGYTFWEYKKASKSLGDNDQEKKLFTYKNDEVQSVKLTRPSGEIELVKDGSEWKMKKPVEDLASGSSVDSFIYAMGTYKGKPSGREDDKTPIKWADYGMEPPGLTIEIKTPKTTETLSVGSKNAFDGSYYLRQGDHLYLGELGMASTVNRDARSFRSKKLWREDEKSAVESAEVMVYDDKVKDKYTLTLKGDKWSVEPPPKYPIDSEKIEQWIKAVQELTPAEIVSDTIDDAEKHNDLLVKPSMVVTFHFKGADGKPAEWTMTAGQDKADDVFVYTNQRTTVYKTRKSALNEIRVTREFFRDGKAPFHFPLEQAAQVEVDNGTFKHIFKKDGSTWSAADLGKDEEFNSRNLENLFENISRLEAQEFMPMSQAKGFKPTQRVVIRDGKGQVLLEIQWGDEYKAKQPFNKSMTFRYIKTNLDKEAMGVSISKTAGLLDTSMVTKKAQVKPKEKGKK